MPKPPRIVERIDSMGLMVLAVSIRALLEWSPCAPVVEERGTSSLS